MGAARASVLVVDDDPELRDWIANELSNRDFAVERASSGPMALQAQARHRFDLALIDLRMPGMDGVETLAALKQRDPEMEAVIATGHGTVPAAVASMKQGAFDFIQKPYTLRQLLPILERALDKSCLQATVALHEASAALLGIHDAKTLLPEAGRLLRRMLRGKAGGFVLTRPDRAFIHADDDAAPPEPALITAVAGLLAEGTPGCRFPDPSVPPLPLGPYGSALATALVARGARIGTLVLFRAPDAGVFTTEELRRALVFSGQIALALDNARLHDELAAKIREVTQARDALIFSEKLALTGQLTAGIAHEINTPLGFVRFNLDFVVTTAEKLLQDPPPGVEAAAVDQARQALTELRTAVVDAREGVERITKILRSLNMFAQPDREQTKPIVLPTVLDWAANVACAQIKTRARLVKDYQPVPLVGGIETRLGQVFVNLLVNASQAIPEGNAEANEITLSLRPMDDQVVIDVRDSGAGIDPAIRERIFEPFFTTKPVGTGTGLGLSICRTIVTEHGGTLSVHESSPQGTTFRVVLPSASA